VERGTWDYVQGGSDGEVTLRENSAAFGRVRLRPRVAGAASGPRWIQGGVPRPDHHARARPSCRTGRVFRCGPHCRRSARREARARRTQWLRATSASAPRELHRGGGPWVVHHRCGLGARGAQPSDLRRLAHVGRPRRDRIVDELAGGREGHPRGR
jgi:hypothetical protein